MFGSGHAFSQAVHAANTTRPGLRLGPDLPRSKYGRQPAKRGAPPLVQVRRLRMAVPLLAGGSELILWGGASTSESARGRGGNKRMIDSHNKAFIK